MPWPAPGTPSGRSVDEVVGDGARRALHNPGVIEGGGMERPGVQITDHFAPIGNLRFHYREAGGKRGPLLCLHGIGSNARAWDGLAADLAPEYRVIAPDLRGRGTSDKPAGPYGLSTHAADALGLMDYLGIERAVVLGWSLGAAVGVHLAALHGDRVEKLVLIDGGDAPPPERRRLWQPFVDRFAQVYPSWEAFLKAMRAFDAYRPWTAAAESYRQADAEVQPNQTVRHNMPPWVIERELAAPVGPRLTQLHPMIRCPTLLLRAPLPLVALGDETPREQFDAMVARIPNARARDPEDEPLHDPDRSSARDAGGYPRAPGRVAGEFTSRR